MHPRSPFDSACYFPRVAAKRRLLVGSGRQQAEESESSGPRSDSDTLDGVCLCPRDRNVSVCVKGTLSDDSVCV